MRLKAVFISFFLLESLRIAAANPTALKGEAILESHPRHDLDAPSDPSGDWAVKSQASLPEGGWKREASDLDVAAEDNPKGNWAAQSKSNLPRESWKEKRGAVAIPRPPSGCVTNGQGCRNNSTCCSSFCFYSPNFEKPAGVCKPLPPPKCLKHDEECTSSKECCSQYCLFSGKEDRGLCKPRPVLDQDDAETDKGQSWGKRDARDAVHGITWRKREIL